MKSRVLLICSLVLASGCFAEPGWDVILGTPRLVVQAPGPEPWGYFQFPTLCVAADGSWIAMWSEHADSAHSYGTSAWGYARSTDHGRTWQPAGPGTGMAAQGLVLPDGDRIAIGTPDTPVPPLLSSLHLPPSHDGGFFQSELPEELRGVYLDRVPKGSGRSIREHAILNDPEIVRAPHEDIFPLVWWGDLQVDSDGTVVTGTYPAVTLGPDGKRTKMGVSFYRSADSGHSWSLLGRIPYTPDVSADPPAARRQGFTEPGFAILSDGDFLCVLRTSDKQGIGPMYLTRSRDHGYHWSQPQVIAPNGVLPRILCLPSRVVVLAAGRPGVQLRFADDPDATAWSEPVDLLPLGDPAHPPSCGYTGLLETSADTFTIIYSDFLHPDGHGGIGKAILVRDVTVHRLKSPTSTPRSVRVSGNPLSR